MKIISHIKSSFRKCFKTKEEKEKDWELVNERPSNPQHVYMAKETTSEGKKNFKPLTYEQTQHIIDLVVDCLQSNAEVREQVAGLVGLARKQQNGNEETKASIDLLFTRIIELEQAIINAGMEIPRANKVVN